MPLALKGVERVDYNSQGAMRSGALADWLFDHRPPLLPSEVTPSQVPGYSAPEAQCRAGTSLC